MNQSVNAVLAKLYTFAFFGDFILIYPLYTLLFADSGISIGQIATLLIAWSFTSFLLEVPSGSIADKYSRKNVLLAAAVIQALAFACWLVFPNYWGFLAGFILWGVNSALTSGTVEALVYDELNGKKALSSYTKVMGRMRALGLGGEILAGIGAALLASQGYYLILILSVVSVIVAGIAVYLLPPSKPVESTSESKLISYIQKGVKLAIQKPNVLFIILFMGVMGGLGSIDEYYSLFFRDRGLTNAEVAIWSSILGIFAIAGSLLAHRFEKKRLPIELFVLLWGAILFSATLAPGFVGPLLIGIFVMFYQLIQILFNTYLQHSIGDETRATTTSVGSLLEELFALMTYGAVGFTTMIGGYEHSFQVVATMIVVFAVILLIYSRYLRRRYGYTYLKP